MKILKFINAFAIGLPILLALLSIIDNDMLFWAIYSTILTGALQVIIAIVLLYIYPKNCLLHLYFFITTLFFVLAWFVIYNMFAMGIPLLLALYLTYIIYNVKDTNHES